MNLTDALALSEREVVALVGGGGKTTAMYRLCAEAAAHDRRAVASGTARFTGPGDVRLRAPLIIDDDESRLVEAVARQTGSSGWSIVATGRGSKGRLSPVSNECVARLAELPDVDLIVVEADGSAMRAFKAPAAHEPAIPPSATYVVAVAGADVLGKPLSHDSVHRPELVSAISGLSLGKPVTPAVLAAVLCEQRGGRKAVPPAARFAILINKVSPLRLSAAREAARCAIQAGAPLVVLAQVRNEDPVVEVFRS